MFLSFLIVTFLSAFVTCATAYPGPSKSGVKHEQVRAFESEDDLFNFGSANSDADDYRNRDIENLIKPRGVHNLTLGFKTFTDRLLYQYTLDKPGEPNGVIAYKVTFGGIQQYRYDWYPYIVYVEATDLHTNADAAGYASLMEGALGETQISLRLESAKGQDLKYYMEVWGHNP